MLVGSRMRSNPLPDPPQSRTRLRAPLARIVVYGDDLPLSPLLRASIHALVDSELFRSSRMVEQVRVRLTPRAGRRSFVCVVCTGLSSRALVVETREEPSVYEAVDSAVVASRERIVAKRPALRAVELG